MIDKFKIIPINFFERGTEDTAKELLGKILIKIEKNELITGKIVETEAYIGKHDPACHAYNKYTSRSKVLYEQGGTMYVYFVYGNYYCFNIVTEQKGIGNAVLIRAIEPTGGLKLIKKRRRKCKNEFDMTNGPAKVCLALNIDKSYNGKMINSEKIFVAENKNKEEITICCSERIGITRGKEFKYRYFIYRNKYVTNHKFNNNAKKI
jgi:DNA-3-methyladenine glycosylase